MPNLMEKLLRCRKHTLQLADDQGTLKYQLLVVIFCKVPVVGHSVKLEKLLKKSFSEVKGAIDQKENLTVNHDKDVDVPVAATSDSLKDGLLLLQLQLCRQHNELLQWKKILSTLVMCWLSTTRNQRRRQHVPSGVNTDTRCHNLRRYRLHLQQQQRQRMQQP